MKTCIYCKKLLSNSNFPKRKSSKDGYRNSCYTCNASAKRDWREANHERLIEVDREYRDKNKLKISEYKREYYLSNVDKLKEYKVSWRKKPLNDIKHRLKNRLRCYGFTIKDLNFTEEEYMNYVISLFNDRYTLEDLFNGIIEIDHIIPISKFNSKLDGFHYSNVQLLTVEEHKTKTKTERRKVC